MNINTTGMADITGMTDEAGNAITNADFIASLANESVYGADKLTSISTLITYGNRHSLSTYKICLFFGYSANRTAYSKTFKVTEELFRIAQEASYGYMPSASKDVDEKELSLDNIGEFLSGATTTKTPRVTTPEPITTDETINKILNENSDETVKTVKTVKTDETVKTNGAIENSDGTLSF